MTLKYLVLFLSLVACVEAFQWDQQLASNALECSHDRANAYLDVLVVYDRTIPEHKFDDFVGLLKRELLPLSLHGDPTKTSRVALIGFDSKASVELDLATKATTSQLEQRLNALPSKRTAPTDKAVLTEALRLALRMVNQKGSTRDLVAILAVSARSVDSDNGAHGTAMELQRKGAHVLTLNFDDENLLLDAYLERLADKGKAFSPYREPYFIESFSRTIDYANCRCESAEFEDGQPIQQLSVYNYTSNHVDYFANCLGAAIQRQGASLREWCSAFNAQPLPTPSAQKTIGQLNAAKSPSQLENLYHFVESFVILNNYELNQYNNWIVGESPQPGKHYSRNAKRLALLAKQSSVALSRPSQWDYIQLNAISKQEDTPYICQRKACDASKPCQEERQTTNYYEMINSMWK